VAISFFIQILHYRWAFAPAELTFSPSCPIAGGQGKPIARDAVKHRGANMQVSRRGAVDPFIVMDVMEAARAAEAAGRSIIHMEVGQPGTGAPQGARDALAHAMDKGALGYTVALGLPELRAGIAALYQSWYGVTLDPARVVVTSGSSAAFLLAFTALFDAGDKVGLGEPGYPSYRQILKALSLEPVGIPASVANRLQPTPADMTGIDMAGMIVASPGNPSGTMLDRAALAALMDHCAAHDIAFISDEIYHGLHYGDRAVSALEISDNAYVINSFSKYFSMTGWRVGWMVVPETHVRLIERLAQNMFICPPHASQIAALAALDCIPELEANRAVYAANRQLMLDGLPAAGFTKIAPPDGAFYIYADVSDLTTDSLQLAADILEGAGVAVTPGLDFDPVRGAQTLRFSYARSTAEITEGLARLQAFMARYTKL
jgi:aspartate/methionine/tyrosine aminotransferase